VRLIAHGTPGVVAARADAPAVSLTLPDDDVPTIAVIGAIGPDKGARRIERVVELARKARARVRFVLIGYMDVGHVPWQSQDAVFTLHGRYDPSQLPQLFAHYRVALMLYPSAGPETFSYTLSEAWAAGVPVLVPPIGALAERVEGSGAGFVMTDAQWRDEQAMLDRILALTAPGARASLAAAGARARAVPHATLAAMTDATFAVYTEALAASRGKRAHAPFDNARRRDALGYRAWQPPQIELPVLSAPSAEAPPRFTTRFARAALAIRHTPVGRALYRMTPRPLLDALKARLTP
jgi:glycosyltransferase involved in cell wall biosynthesis